MGVVALFTSGTTQHPKIINPVQLLLEAQLLPQRQAVNAQ
jgi:hypothetical protein